MKTLIVSDLHLEFHKDKGKEFISLLPDAEMIILAGDITTHSHFINVFSQFAEKYSKVVHIAGNHEFYDYNTSIPDLLKDLSNQIPNYYFLENEVLEIDGLRILGCTLWFPKSRDNGGDYLNDFNVIADFEPWVYEQNNRSLKFLQTQLKDPNDIVVTHHLPSYQSVHWKYQGSPLNCFFVCNVESLIKEKQPRLWIHGHSHESMNYKINETQILSNPFGYFPFEMNPNFNSELIIDL